MFRVTVNYNHPADPERFLAHYRGTHAPLASKLPGLRHFGWGATTSLDDTEPPHFLVAILEWDTREEAAAALASPEGQAAQADMANFADGGASVNMHEVVQVTPAGGA
ncbi:EthD family reductase [Prauserella rugosa]|uniref:Uncharacterized protein (TIGR02118 family) n=1 Tax=Prauserella rugosa TaxID=43354 RepID=A0A660CBH0_9PSEU|nr:EthD family reductase [Prauserella rugosa]TWH19674.1 uncharacterized protein (TIGR02118 family) [Prauserella rugosa]